MLSHTHTHTLHLPSHIPTAASIFDPRPSLLHPPFLPGCVSLFSSEQGPPCPPLTFHCLSFTNVIVLQQIYLQRQMNRALSSSWSRLTHLNCRSKIRSNRLTSQLSDSVAGLSGPTKNSSTQSVLPYSVIERDRATVPSSLYHKGLSAPTQHLLHLHQKSPALSSCFSSFLSFLCRNLWKSCCFSSWTSPLPSYWMLFRGSCHSHKSADLCFSITFINQDVT